MAHTFLGKYWGSGAGAQHGPNPAAAPPGALGLCRGVPELLGSCPGIGAGQDSAPPASPISALPWALAFILGELLKISLTFSTEKHHDLPLRTFFSVQPYYETDRLSQTQDTNHVFRLITT